MQEFPYPTTTEAIDVQAGVRFCARHCFILETISIDIKPKVRTARPGYDVLLRDEFLATAAWEGKTCGGLPAKTPAKKLSCFTQSLGAMSRLVRLTKRS
jgi:hypothetical protein